MNIIINPAYRDLEEFINNIPVSFPNEEKIIYKGKRNILKLMDAGSLKTVIKSFKVPHLINKIAYSYVRSSKAKRSYEFGLEIIKRGINTPTPIAYIEDFKLGLLDHSYYICEYCHYGSFKVFNSYPGSNKDKVDILIAFAEFTAAMHNAQIYHLDYSNGNILFNKSETTIDFSLVDLNRIVFGEVDKDKSYRAFHRLYAGKEMLHIIAERYAIKRGFNVKECIEMVEYYNTKTMNPSPLDEWPPLNEQSIPI